MKFWLFLIAATLLYCFFSPKNSAQQKSKEGIEISEKKSPQNTKKQPIKYSSKKKGILEFPWYYYLVGIFFVVVYIKTSRTGRTIWQGTSQTKARNAMIAHIKESGEKVIGYDRGEDEFGKYESIETQDRFGNQKYYTTGNTDGL